MYAQRRLGGRYRLEHELGRGGMAVVWRARDEVLGRPVAVKVLAGRYAGDPDARDRILREARAAATLSHPNIAHVYDFGESDGDGTPYVVMELINGPTLQQRLASGPLPARTAFRICGEVAAALAVAHEDGLVHRDIKLANVMVTPTGAKVVDFGIAAAAGPIAPEDALLGTPAYLAPERLAGGAVEPASDVYALGVLLYRLLAGRMPWSVETTTQMIDAHIYREPAPLPPLPGVPSLVDELLRRCLAKDPALRPSAVEVSGALGDAAEAASAAPASASASAAPASAAPASAAPDAAVLDSAAPASAAQSVESAGGETGSAAASPEPTGPAGAVVDGIGVVRKPRRRARLLAGAGLAGLVGVAPWLLSTLPPARTEPGVAASPPGPAISVSRTPSATPSGDKPIRVLAPPRAAGSDPTPASPAPPIASLPPATPSLAATGSVVPSISASPDGIRLESPGGTVVARCVSGRAELLDWEPNPGFTAEQVERGPALTAAIVFAGPRSRYRMTVTCVAGRPTPVVLPL